MLVVAALGCLAIALMVSCSNDEQGVVEPAKPAAPMVIGLNSTRPSGSLVLCAETQSGGSQLEYQFDFLMGQDGGLTDWSPDSCKSYHWGVEGRYEVGARIRQGTLVSDWSDNFIVVIIDETITPPEPPVGDDIVVVGGDIRLCGSSGASSLGHTIEYRFKIEPDLVLDWHIARCSSTPWTMPGTFKARAQARCLLHNGIISHWSRFFEFSVVSGADTRIVQVISQPEPGAGQATEINFLDGAPDTVASGSWVTVIVEGSNPDYAAGTCTDPINRCISFQFQYERFRATAGNSHFVSAWLPFLPFDSNPNGLEDTLRMNIGSVDYDILARAVDEFAGDVEPPRLPLVGNFAPVLDDYYIESHDGTVVRHGDTLTFDWWSPENADTVDLAAGERKKQFSFTITATGHDDARDAAGSAIKGWRYFFIAVDNPALLYDFGRAGSWVEALQDDVLSDVVTWTVTYPLDDINGDSVLANLPIWMNREWDFAIRGRDTGPSDTFQQLVHVNGETIPVNQYGTWEYGRRTEAGFQRFFIRLEH
jgi:hypothetical protein